MIFVCRDIGDVVCRFSLRYIVNLSNDLIINVLLGVLMSSSEIALIITIATYDPCSSLSSLPDTLMPTCYRDGTIHEIGECSGESCVGILQTIASLLQTMHVPLLGHYSPTDDRIRAFSDVL